ncbi:MAG: type II secretion system protein GspN [Bdellovibrionales bacterium]|nr:type II secretion system protein GspN [Bdellovibrionales bacterium]
MATATEVQSLNDIDYKSKIKIFFLILIALFLFIISFLNFYPIGEKIKSVIKTSFNGGACKPDFEEIHMEWLMPKIVVSNLVIPASCLDRAGEPLKFSHLTINYHLISFAPFGLPFKIDTSFGGQDISMYFVQGINSQMIRLKDQTLDLMKLQPILGENVKLSGKVTVDLNMAMSKSVITNLTLKAQSKNFQVPPQSIQGFTTPPLKLNEFYLEAASEAHPRILIEKLILGDTDAPVRANLKGRIDLQEGNAAMSPLDMVGEIAFSESLKKAVPVDMLLGSFTQKDGFYQIRLGGTLGSPKPIGP